MCEAIYEFKAGLKIGPLPSDTNDITGPDQRDDLHCKFIRAGVPTDVWI